jgi:protocatechuate 3,4-dioxygenase alpha subunit
MATATASQTIGPYWHLIEDPSWSDLTRFGAAGERITLTGRITDGAGALVSDACVEIWQTSPAASAQFEGFGRSRTDANGEFHFTTLKPTSTPGTTTARGNSRQAPHLALTLLARGLMKALVTRVYFAAGEGLETDPVLSLIEDPARRATLIAHETEKGAWRLDIVLQGDNETVFFEI